MSYFFKRALVVLIGLISMGAHAGTTVATMLSSTTLTPDCTLSIPSMFLLPTTTLNAVNSQSMSAPWSSTCTKGTSFEVSADAGSTPGGTTTTRKMVDVNGNTFNYQLFRGSAGTVALGNTSGTDTFQSVGMGRSTPITGILWIRTVAGQVVIPGNYYDTITFTVKF